MSRPRCSFCNKRDNRYVMVGPRGVAICNDCVELARDLRGSGPGAPSGELLINGIGTLITNDPKRDGLLGTIQDAAVAVRHGRVTWVGPEASMPDRYRELPTYRGDGRVVLPGFVDSHTHLVFAGDRSAEFGRRMRGESYEEILASGGGIHSTVAATRAASRSQLVREASERAARMLANGTTTVEAKSGYGLTREHELRLLEIAAEVDRSLPIDVVSTFLGAHVIPSEMAHDRSGYVDGVVASMSDAAPLAEFVDVFCDEGAFGVEEAREVLSAGMAAGLRPRVHANQLGATGGVELAIEVGAASADHLDHLTIEQAAAMAEAGVAAVLLPAASMALRSPPPPGRLLWESGATVAIATDCNPGTSNVESMPYIIALAMLDMGLTPEQAIWSATKGGARALQRPTLGSVLSGQPADLVVLDSDTYLDLAYKPDRQAVAAVVKAGDIVIG